MQHQKAIHSHLISLMQAAVAGGQADLGLGTGTGSSIRVLRRSN